MDEKVFPIFYEICWCLFWLGHANLEVYWWDRKSCIDLPVLMREMLTKRGWGLAKRCQKMTGGPGGVFATSRRARTHSHRHAHDCRHRHARGYYRQPWAQKTHNRHCPGLQSRARSLYFGRAHAHTSYLSRAPLMTERMFSTSCQAQRKDK